MCALVVGIDRPSLALSSASRVKDPGYNCVMSRSTSRWVGLAFAILSGAAGLAFIWKHHHVSRQWREVSLMGREAPWAEAALDTWLSQRAAQFAAREVFLSAGDEEVPVSFCELGLSLDLTAAKRHIVEATPADDAGRQLRRLLGPARELLEVPVPTAFDATLARTRLEALAPALARDAVDARLDVAAHQVIHDRAGRRLDVDASLETIRSASLEAPLRVPLSFQQVPARVRREDLPPVDVSRVLSSYETSFRRKAGARAINIKRAAELLDGTIIAPGETLSFNATVGRRTHARGFVDAPVIVRDEMERGVGGGVCQVATTLHAAAVFGNLAIRQRRSHSRPSGYAPLGLDATVLDGKVDLRLGNPYEHALMVHAYLPSRYVIRVELLGADAPGRVEHHYTVLERHDYYRRIVRKEDLSPGAIERAQKGSYGYETLSRVVLHRPDGSVTRHRYRSKYYPVPEVFWVAPGVPYDELPPLPDGATHVEM